MPILTLASSKGGAGKSTIAMALAGTLARGGVPLVAFDADRNATLARWARQTYEGPAFECIHETDEAALAHAIRDAADRTPLVLIDTPGFANRASAVAATSADAVLVPCKSSEGDVREAREAITLVRALSASARREIGAAVLLNGVRQTTVSQHAAAQVGAAGLPRLKAVLSLRAAFEELTFSGRVPTSGDAWREIDRLVDELRDLGWVPSATPLRVDAATA